jgi:hypothetical protein
MQDRERGIPVPEEQMVQETYATKTYDDGTEKYRPSRMECLRDYEITIRFLSSGCVINVGCKQVAFSTTKEAMNAFTDYINDPYTVRQIWEKRFQEEQ